MERPDTISIGFTARVRFNWGFWDARLDQKEPHLHGDRRASSHPHTIVDHFDSFYAGGYRAGWESEQECESSGMAWKERQAVKKAQAQERKRIRDMRPSPLTTRVQETVHGIMRTSP